MPAINLSLPCKRLQEQSYSGGGNLYLAGLHGPGLPIRYHRVHLIFIIISGQGASDMASVLLIYPYFNPPNIRSIFRFPPLGAGYVASGLRNAGYDVGILDCTFMNREDAMADAVAYGADVVGIYCMVTMHEECIRFARALRGQCDLLVAGGPLPSCDPYSFMAVSYTHL